jgi:hypothetical protein
LGIYIFLYLFEVEPDILCRNRGDPADGEQRGIGIIVGEGNIIRTRKPKSGDKEIYAILRCYIGSVTDPLIFQALAKQQQVFRIFPILFSQNG